MSDVLSQSEIDALLAAMASGGFVEETSDNSPKEEELPPIVLQERLKFPEKDLQILEYIHKEYAEVLSSNLLSNIEVKVVLESIQEISYEEFRHSIPCPAVIGVFKLKPLDSHLIFEASTDFISKISQMCSDEAIENGQEIETFNQVTGSFIKQLEKPWSSVLSVTSEVEYMETDPANIKELLTDESVVLLSLSVTLKDFTNLFNICIPYSSMERYLGKLAIRPVFPKMESSLPFENATVNIKAVLTELSMSLGELMELQKGIVLNTHKPYNNKVKILVEEKHCFDGEAGLLHNRKAVKIVNCLDKDVQR
jgi:flagellar motor switch protein FliM